MNWVKASLIVIATAWLQLATLPAIRPFGIVPNLALLVVVMVAIRAPLEYSLGVAIALGWLLDVGAGSNVGLRLIFYPALVAGVDLLRHYGSDLDNFSLQASIVVAATVVFNLVILLGLALSRASLPLSYIGLHLTGEIVMNVALFWPVRWIINRSFGVRHDIAVSIGGRRG